MVMVSFTDKISTTRSHGKTPAPTASKSSAPTKKARLAEGPRQAGASTTDGVSPVGLAVGQGDAPKTATSKSTKKTNKGFLDQLTTGSVIQAPDGTKWTVIDTNVSTAGKRGQENVVKEVPGPSPYAKRYVVGGLTSSSWRLIVDEAILKHIKNCTEKEARRALEKDDWCLPLGELDAFLGILYLRGVTESKNVEVDLMWSEKYGFPFIKNVMSRDRFREIMRFLRFDDKSTRSIRLQSDKFALVSEVFDKFVSNSQACYIPGPFITVDEQLFPSKTRCPFTQFMPDKPDKYGQKFFVATDKESKYVINMFPYLGKEDKRPDGERLGDHVVKRLVDPYLNKGRNVTCDNYFTSLKLAEFLKSKKTTLVGTVNRARREVPVCVKQAKEKLYSTKAFAKEGITLTVYQGKSMKNVVLLSSMHSDVSTENDTKSKPNTVLFYNSTKYGVDVVDQMARKYSVKSASRRWPIHTFFNILDFAGINAWIRYRDITKEKISRREFLFKLGEELTQELLDSRKSAPAVRMNAPLSGGSRKRCQVRVACNQSRSTNECTTCGRVVCKLCIGGVSYICKSCQPEDDEVADM